MHSTAKFVDNGYYCIDTNCIENFEIIWEKARFVNKQTFEERISRLTPKKDDILFSREGTIGTVVRYKGENPICLGQRMMMFRFASFLKPEFAEIFLASDFFKNQYQPLILGTTAQHLNIGSIRNLIISIPAPEEQAEIVKRVEELFDWIDQIETDYNKAQEQLRVLPQMLLQKAFRGELTPQYASDESAEILLKRIKEEKGSTLKNKKERRKQSLTI